MFFLSLYQPINIFLSKCFEWVETWFLSGLSLCRLFNSVCQSRVFQCFRSSFDLTFFSDNLQFSIFGRFAKAINSGAYPISILHSILSHHLWCTDTAPKTKCRQRCHSTVIKGHDITLNSGIQVAGIVILLCVRTVLIMTHLHVFSPKESAVTYFRYLITNLVVEHSQIKCFVKKVM